MDYLGEFIVHPLGHTHVFSLMYKARAIKLLNAQTLG